MKLYLELMQRILNEGVEKKDRTGTGTVSIFGHQMRFDLSKGFPLVTTKKCHLRSIIHELLWFLNGDTNTEYLEDNGVTIWQEWAATEDVFDVKASIAKIITYAGVDVTPEEYVAYWLDTTGVNPFEVTQDEAIQYVRNYHATEKARLEEWHGEPSELDVNDFLVYTQRKGDLGPVYGKQWRDWMGPNGEHHDQIANVLRQLREDPDSRRIIVSAWNVADLDKMALAPCHAFMQFYTRELSYDERVQLLCNEHADIYDAIEKKSLVSPMSSKDVLIEMDAAGVPKRELSLQLYQRSCDTFLGLPFNIASYAILTHMIAYISNMSVGDFVWTGGDIHLYSNHLDQAKIQLMRQPKNLPKFVWLTDRKVVDPKDFRLEDFDIVGYDPHPGIKAPIAI